MQMNYRILLLLLLCLTGLTKAAADEESIPELQEQMYKLFPQADTARFFDVTNRLKAQCLQENDERGFYKAWGNQAIYESSKYRRSHAMEIAKEMKEYAAKTDSKFGLYTSTHVMASIYYQMQNYHEAEMNFMEAIENLHSNFPGESAAADYLELEKIYAKTGSLDTAYVYAERVFSEPNVAPVHQLRALSMMCQLVALKENPDRELFNRLYERRTEVRSTTSADGLEQLIEVFYFIINQDYERAMELAKKMPAHERYYLIARICHEQGDDSNAYRYLMRDKQASDSANNNLQRGLLTDYMEQLTNERLEVERHQDMEEAMKWRTAFFLTIAALIISLLAFVVYRRYKTIGKLEKRNESLKKAHAKEHEARKAEQQAREQAEKALDIKREFLNNISQELREPLNPITGFSDILATPGFELGPEEREAMSQHIKQSSQMLTGLIDHMIELSFYESKTSLPKEDKMIPNVICMHMADTFRPKCRQGVKLQVDSVLSNNLSIMTDVQSVEKVLGQLLANAVEYTEKGAITLGCAEHEDHIRFTVTDTGPGIEEEMREHIFEPMVKASENVKTTSMDLAICKLVANLLGGQLLLDEKYTDGSRFIFEIPKE